MTKENLIDSAKTTLAAGAAATAMLLPSAASASIERVEFRSGGERVVGRLHLPSDYKQGQRLPALVVTGAWMTVKEQMAGRYAEEMAKRGFAALDFDFRGWGESGGARRQFEDPKAKIEDILAAVAYLRTRPESDKDHVGGLGICASSGYMVTAATRTKDLKAVALVAPWLHDREIVEQTYGGKEGVAKLVAAGRAAQAEFDRTGAQSFLPAASLTDERAIMFKAPYYTEPARGMIPQWRNEADPALWEGWLTFDAIQAAPRLSQPFFMVHSEAAAIPQGAHRFYAGLAAPKGELWLDNVTQFEFYDREEPVGLASDAVAAHFRKALTTEAQKRDLNERALAGTREFFAALEAMDIPRFLKVWAEDGVQEMPYAPGTFPRRLKGKAAIERQYGPLPSAFDSMRFKVRRMAATDEPGVVLAEFDGSISLKTGGRYDNRYVGVFAFDRTGRLARYAEYFDPLTLARGFPGAAALAASDDERASAAVLAVGSEADARNWEGVHSQFADEVRVDYQTVTGQPAATVKADDLVAGWKTGLTRYDRTEHRIGDLKVEVRGDEATATSRVIATHVRGAERWTCGGRYVHHLVRKDGAWKIDAIAFTVEWEQGVR